MQGAKTLKPELVVTSALEKNGICVRVQDNGPGIPPDLLPMIFRPNVTAKTNGLSFGPRPGVDHCGTTGEQLQRKCIRGKRTGKNRLYGISA